MSLPGAGWYPDSIDTGLLRWWSGEGWTAHVQSVPVNDVPQPPAVVLGATRAQPEQQQLQAQTLTAPAVLLATDPGRGPGTGTAAGELEPEGPQIFRSSFIGSGEPADGLQATDAPQEAGAAHAAVAQHTPVAPPAPWADGLPPVSPDGRLADLEALLGKRAAQLEAERMFAIASSTATVTTAPAAVAPSAAAPAPVTLAAAVPAAPYPAGIDFDALLRSSPAAPSPAAPSHTAPDAGSPAAKQPRGRHSRIVSVALVGVIVGLGGCGWYLAPLVVNRF